jgi:hydrophobic/amphiphilic exporter-1 (mainly G- bacteria), HAE1 family
VNLSEFAIRRPIAIMMVVVGVILIGLVSSSKIPFTLLPDITYPKLTIRTEYPHAAPEEVENLVTKPIEQTVGIIQNVVKQSSVSRTGMSEVVVEFRWGVDMDVAVMDIREKLQLLEGFLPDGVKKPVLLRYDPGADPIMTIGIAGKMELSELRFLVEREVERELERIDGVAAVKVEGGYEDEIVIALDEAKLARFKLTPDTVISRLQRENINLAGGTLTEAGEELSVRTLNEFKDLDEIKSVVVSTGASGGAAASGLSALGGLGGGLGSLGGLAGMFMGGGLNLSGLTGMLPGVSGGESTTEVSVPIRLGDIAEVRVRHKPREEIVRLNGKECIKVSIYKEGDANIVQVAGMVNKAMDKIKDNLRLEAPGREETRKLKSPVEKLKRFVNWWVYLFFYTRPFHVYTAHPKLMDEIEINTISDQSSFIRDSVFSVIQAAMWAAIIAILVLYIFLRNIPSTWIIGVAIPISVIATFTLMYFTKISFNTMSLAGLALGVGNVVDNSIVVLENILRHRAKSKDLRGTAVKATGEVGLAIIASTTTNIIVFFPILYVEGMFRQVFGDLALTVTYSMIASVFAAMIMVPMLAVHLGARVKLPKKLADPDLIEEGQLDDEEERVRLNLLRRPAFSELGKTGNRLWRGTEYLFLLSGWAAITAYQVAVWGLGNSFLFFLRTPLRWFDDSFNSLKMSYPKLVAATLKQPGKVFTASLILLVVAFLGLFFVGFELLPDVDQNEFRAHLRLPVGTPIEESDRRLTGIESKMKALPGADKITNVFTTVGASGMSGEMEIEKSENLGEMVVTLAGRADRPFSDNQMISRLRGVLRDEVNLQYYFSKPQLFSYKNPVEIEIVGYNLNELRNASRLSMNELVQIPGLADLDSSVKEANPEIAINVDRERAAHFGLTASGVAEILQKKVKGSLATNFREQDRQTDIMVEVSEDQRQSIGDLANLSIPVAGREPVLLSALADIRPSQGPGNITRVSGSRVALIRANLNGINLGEAVSRINRKLGELEFPRGTYYRITGQNEEMNKSINSLYLAIFLAVFLVYISLSAQFGSLLHPFVIMFGAFYSLIGLTVLFLITGTTINVFSLIGIIMMIGNSVNAAILLVSTVNELRAEGADRITAIVNAAQFRLRPNLITSLNTIIGMIPMALPIGEGYEFRIPMAVAVIGGLSGSLFFSLTVVPSIYLLFDTAGEKVRAFFWPAAVPAEPQAPAADPPGPDQPGA